MKLYGSVRSPYVVKVRLVLAEKGIPCAFDELSPSAPEVAAANPLAKIPALLRDDGTCLYDSSVIVEYIDGLTPSPRLIPEAFAARIEVRRWEALGNGIIDALVAIMHNARLPEAQQREAAYIDKQRAKIDAGLATMERDLGAGPFCYGDSFTLADISCAGALRYLEQVLKGYDWREDYPGLARHMAVLAARPAFG